MNIYVDFDNTVYDTKRLTDSMILGVAKAVSENKNLSIDEVLEKINREYDPSKDNIYLYCEAISEFYGMDKEVLYRKVDFELDNGRERVYPDTWNFFNILKDKGHNIVLLTFIPNQNQVYQMKKLIGSGLAKYYNILIMTASPKYEIDIDYHNGIFFDDEPITVQKLYDNNPYKVYRVRRKNAKYSHIDIEKKEIEEIENFNEVDLDII